MLKQLFQHTLFGRRLSAGTLGLAAALLLAAAGVVYANVPGGRTPPQGTVPNPGTQQQELANITFPAPYNVYEFVVTCAGCHGGGIDQSAGHFSNWAGTSMASAARDPVFRANEMIVNQTVLAVTGQDGAGNMCFRCHSPNGWYSGRFDPNLAGDPRGTTMEHSILASTDDEGILCEFCHRAIGNVTMRRSNLDPNDPVWNLLAGVSDWPHAGGPFVDQFGDPSIAAGNPYGDTSLQIDDGMTYIAKYPGSVDVFYSDLPLAGTLYTGQTYGVYPSWYTGPKSPVPPGEPQFNSAGQEIVYNPDGSVPIHYEVPIGPPLLPGGGYDYQNQAVSLEHPTVGALRDPNSGEGAFVTTSEFCGSCHDLTVPVLNHGMPEQRTYTEWKFSDFGRDDQSATYQRCQDCHMPTQKHEYSDTAAVSLNPDPVISGWWPYGKDRNPNGGTAFHKFDGANRDLPDYMQILYPEVDLEVIGAPTGNDPRIFPGMLSDRSSMWERAQRNTEISLQDAVDVQIVTAPTMLVDEFGNPILDPNTGNPRWEVQVKVTNTSGHRIPSGYPDGRRLFISLQVTDANGVVIYKSGVYDEAAAELKTTETEAFKRALTARIDENNNAVMVYERVTGTCVDAGGAAIFPDPTAGVPAACAPSPALTNNFILFDNRIPPAGFSAADYQGAGVKFITYDPATWVPREDNARYPDGRGYDVVTYVFDAPLGSDLDARADLFWQTHTREFMEHLKTNDTSTIRPEGPPSIFEPNYPLVPNYLSDRFVETTGIAFSDLRDLDGQPLRDNWGGVAYGAWLLSGKGAPYLVGSAATNVGLPPAPTGLQVLAVFNPDTGLNDPFSQQIVWNPVAGADGYRVWIRYGKDTTGATAAWDQLAIVMAPTTELLNTALNVNKTFGYRVQAFNAAGYSPMSAVVNATTTNDLPLPPMNTTVVSALSTGITLSWFDQADNEDGFVIERQDVPVTGPFVEIARLPTPNGAASGGVNWTDASVVPGLTYNYRVAAYNVWGLSTFDLPVQAAVPGAPPSAPGNLRVTAVTAFQVDLAWDASTGVVNGYRVERSADNGLTWISLGNALPTTTAFSDATVQPLTTYQYRVFAFNTNGDSPASNTVTATTPDLPPAAPSNLAATAPAVFPPREVNLSWRDNANNEAGFKVWRAVETEAGLQPFVLLVTLNTPAAGTGATVTYKDTTVEPKMTYHYKVVAFNAAGDSAFSNEVAIVTPGEIPQAPTNLRLVSRTRTSITMRWNDNSNNEQGFQIWRLNGTWKLIATVGPNVTTYTNTGLTPNTTYSYRVRAYNADGFSAYSNILTTKTLR